MKLRKITIVGDVGYVPLTQGKTALIDAEDAEFVGQWNWYANNIKGCFYAARCIYIPLLGGGQKTLRVPLHRALCNVSPSLMVDHIDGNSLNNKRSNLRACINSQNQANRKFNSNSTSGFKGVGWHKGACKWHAKLTIQGQKVHLGQYNTKEEAALAYNEAATKYFGEFARLNVVPSQVQAPDSLVQIYEEMPVAA